MKYILLIRVIEDMYAYDSEQYLITQFKKSKLSACINGHDNVYVQKFTIDKK